MKNTLLCAAMVILSCGFALGQAQEKVVWSFGASGDGSVPTGKPVFDRAGNLYGTTFDGGWSNFGTVYELSPTDNGWNETILYSFCSQLNCPDGHTPWAGLIWDKSGNLYGTTEYGGTGNGGTVFELSPPPAPGGPWTLTTLWDFNNDANGAVPFGRLTWDAYGNLYGTTSAGGEGNCGTVFELSPVSGGWNEQAVHTFSWSGDGCTPYAGVTFDKHGNLFGTTARGGVITCNDGEGCGSVFELSQNPNQTWTETMLLLFDGSNGESPWGEVNFDTIGNLYSTFSLSPNCIYCGGAFKISTAGGEWRYSPFFFDGQDGGNPLAGLLLDMHDRSAYGTASLGGHGNACHNTDGCGTVFTIQSGKEIVLYNFCSQPNCTDGSVPFSALSTDGKGHLYGTTQMGGTYGLGVVFEITP